MGDQRAKDQQQGGAFSADDDNEFETVSLLAKPSLVGGENLIRSPGGAAPRSASRSTTLGETQQDVAQAHGDRDTTSDTLLSRTTAAPTSSRWLQGLLDLALAAVAVLPFLAIRSLRIVLNCLDVPEHRWRGAAHYTPLSTDDRRQLRSTAHDLQTGSYPLRRSRLATAAAMYVAADAAVTATVNPAAIPYNTTTADSHACPNASSSVISQPWAALTPAQRVLNDLHCILAALAACADHWQLEWQEAAQVSVHAVLGKQLEAAAKLEQLDLQTVLKRMRKEGKVVARNMVSIVSPCDGGAAQPTTVLKYYLLQLLLHQSQYIPQEQRNVLLQLPGGGTLLECSSLVPLTAACEYLELQGEKYAEYARFMRRFGRYRPSDIKKEWALQGTTINARYHAIGLQHADGGPYQEITGGVRCGAFAVHGGKKGAPGLAAMVATLQQVREAQSLLPSPGASGTSVLQQLEDEAEGRRVLVVAQALPVILACVRQACQRASCLHAAAASGSFLHVQHSLLSDMDPRERAYLQDTQGALQWLSKNLTIRFSSKPPRSVEATASIVNSLRAVAGGGGVRGTANGMQAADLHMQGGNGGDGGRSSTVVRGPLRNGPVTLWVDVEDVPVECLPAGCNGRADLCAPHCSFGLHAVMFSQGFNILQSLGFLMSGGRGGIQDVVNCAAVAQLNAYALRAGRTCGPGLAALNLHYSPAGQRPAKDMESIRLVRIATAELGGVRAVNCKSGKDRTALETSISLVQAAVAEGVVPASAAAAVRAELHMGLSFQQTGQNSGQPNAYAFNEMELAALPSGWRLDWRLCGKALS